MVPLPTDRHPETIPVIAEPGLPPAASPMGAGDRGDAPIDWRRVRLAVLRYKWLVLGILVAGAAAGVAATRLVAPQYLAQATIWIDQHDQRGGATGAIQGGRLLAPEAWVELLQSYAVLDSVVRSERLFLGRPPGSAAAFEGFALADDFQPGRYRIAVDPATGQYTLRQLSGVGGIEVGRVGDSIGTRFGFRWRPTAAGLGTGRPLTFDVSTPRDAARALTDQLDVHIDPDGNILRVQLSGSDPVRVAAVLNAISGRFVALAGDLERQRLTEVTGILSDQLRYAQQNLAGSEAALQAFGIRTITLPGRTAGGAGDPALERYFALQTERDQLRADQSALLRAAAGAGDSGIDINALNLIPAVQRSQPFTQALADLAARKAALAALRVRYSDAYPAVAEAAGAIAASERQALPALARGLASDLAQREAELTRQLTAAEDGLRGVPPREIEETRLRRNVLLADNLYTNLQQRYDEARLAEVSTVPAVRILDRAVAPDRPDKDTAPRLLAMALVAAIGGALAVAILLDRMDPRFRYPAQVSEGMGLPILGVVPHLRASGSAEARTEATAAVVEALRGVRFAVAQACGGDAGTVLTVTSPGSGDGKSFVTANLALAFAEAGHRTILIDGDVRRGSLHRRFGLERRPGLADLLARGLPLDAVIRATRYPYLDLLPSGHRSPVAPELLGTPAMRDLVRTLRARYDVVLVDSPPLSAGVDALALGTATGRLALVLRTGVSHLELTQTKLEVLRRMPVQLIGAVLNDVPGGVAYGYYSYYLPGYVVAEDERQAGGGRSALPV